MGDIYHEHMEQIEEMYFFGESDPYNDECEVGRCRETLNEMFPITGPFARSPMARLSEAEHRVDVFYRDNERLKRDPFREGDVWGKRREQKLIVDMTVRHLINASQWCAKQIPLSGLLWWSLMRLEFEIACRFPSIGTDCLKPFEQHLERCRKHQWAEQEIGWFRNRLEELKRVSSAALMIS